MNALRIGRWVAIGLALAAGLGLMAGGWWMIWTLEQQGRDAAQRLTDTQTALVAQQEALRASEQARDKLTQDYEVLKQRWVKTDGDVQQSRGTAEALTARLAAASGERVDLTRQLEQMTGQRAALQDQALRLQQMVSAGEALRQRLEADTASLRGRALTIDETRQLAEVFAAERAAQERLRQQLAALSHEYEQLAQQRRDRGGPHIARAPMLQAPVANTRELASLYRNLGASYLATYQYAQAADAYEHSLTLEEDPEVHATLAFLYSRLQFDAGKAARHLAASPRAGASRPVSTTQAQGLPRSSWRLVWRWLTE